MDKEPTLAEVAAELKAARDAIAALTDGRLERFTRHRVACLTVAHRVVAQAAAEEARNVAAGDMAGGAL